MFSHKCKYAIRAVIFLATRNKQLTMTSGTEIARVLNTPMAFTVKILQELARKKLIHSTKGPKGGFYIDESLKSIPMLSIVKAIDGIGVFHRCGIGLDACSDEHPCPFHETFKENREKLLAVFSSKTIGDFCIDCFEENYFITNFIR